MARQMCWKELENKMPGSSVVWEAGMKWTEQKRPEVVPVYMLWPSAPIREKRKEASFLKLAAVFSGIVLAGLALGLTMARFLL